MSGRAPRVCAALASRRVPWLVAGLVGLLLVPTLFLGLSADDYSHWLRANGELPYGSRFDVFDFCDGKPGTIAFLRDGGVLSWWTVPGLRVHFFRPLTSIWHWADYTLWPHAAWFMHLENAALSAGLAAAAAIWYRRILGPTWTAGLAALLYAVEPGHGIVGWIAFRNAVLATLLGVLALIAHDRDRARAGAGAPALRPSALLGPLLFAASLAAGEAAVATFAYLIAYAVAIDPARPARRVASLVPYAVVVGAWQAAYRLHGYGAFGSGIYFDPGREPVRYLTVAPRNAVSLLLGQFATPPADATLALPESGQLVLFGLGVVLLAWIAWVVTPLVLRDRACRFFLLGALLSVPTICATFPSNRLLFFVSLGAAGLLAKLVQALREGVLEGARRKAARVYSVAWLVLHGLLAPPLFVASSLAFWGVERTFDGLTTGLPTARELAGRRVILVNGPDLIFPLYRFVVPHDGVLMHGAPGFLLSVTTSKLLFERKGPTSFRLSATDDLASQPTGTLFRSDAFPLSPGERFYVGTATVRVDGVADNGHAKVATFDLGAKLEDHDYVWVAWNHGRYVAFSPPPVGASVTVGGN